MGTMSMPPVHPPSAREAQQPPATALAQAAAQSSATPCWPSELLLGSGAEVHIRHGEALYRLRLTRQGKLILTK